MSVPRNDTFTHTTKTRDGELRISEVHGRIHETFRSKDSRIPVTAQMDLDDAALHYQRGLELVRMSQAAHAARELIRLSQAAHAAPKADNESA